MTMTDAAYEKFLPEGIPDWQMAFWQSLRSRKAAVQRCDECGTFRFIPKERCPKCLSPAATWTPISGNGEIYTYTVVHRAPTPAYQADAPYVIAHVTMEEGFRMASNLRGVDPAVVRIGMPVRLTYDEVTAEWTLPVFEPAE
jgi:uncharacterized OB-fold protein